MRDKEIRLQEMPSRVICERQEDGSVSCRVFESDQIRDFKIESEEENPGTRKKTFGEPMSGSFNGSY